ncbi:hypothetical protein [Fusobacterium sp.]|uniref:hypothetical protein n=1 Tax=Fusobacterium sp. TaxID=68766 RepID=UPI0026189E63|nr:hypothetical protein [Fusobacterium sp.]
MKKILFIFLVSGILGTVPLEAETLPKPSFPVEMGELPEVPTQTPEEEVAAGWKLEKNYTVVLESKLNVFVPLEIISDIDIDAVVIDKEEATIPFEIVLNKEPERKDYYKLKFSETEIDIDNDGRIDTVIYSPKYINQRIIRENYVKIQGENISEDGKYSKKIYITVEVDE